MHRLAIALMLLALVAAAIGGALLLSLNRLIAGNRERIVEQASVALGRPLVVDRISASLRGGIGVRLDNVRVAQEPEFGTADLLRAESVMVHLKLRPLLHGHLEFTRIDTEHPVVTLVRTAAGNWNYASLPLVASAGLAPVAVATNTPSPAWLIATGNIARGKLVIIANNEASSQRVEINQIDLALANISMTAPVRFKLVAAVDAEQANVRLDGQVGPLQRGDPIPLECSGTLGPLGPIFIADIEATLAIRPGDAAQVTQFNGRALGGSFMLTGQLPLREGVAAAMSGQVRDINLGRFLNVFFDGAAERVDGTAQLSVDIRMAEAFAKTPLQTLAATITLQAARGTLKDVNLLDELLQRSAGIGAIATLLPATVKTKYNRALTAAITRFETLQATIRIADQLASTDDFVLRAPEYDLLATGQLRFTGDIDAALTLSLSPELSNDISTNVKEAKYLVDEHGRLSLPFRWRGKIAETRPEPDPARLSDLLRRAVAHGAAKDWLGKLLGEARGGSDEAQRDAARRRVEQGLRDLLGH